MAKPWWEADPVAPPTPADGDWWAKDALDPEFIRGPVHRAERPGVLEEFGAKAKAGFIGARDALGSAMAGLFDLSSDETRAQEEAVSRNLGFRDRAEAERYRGALATADSERAVQTADTTHPDTQRGLQEIATAEGPWDATKAIARNPRAVGATIAQSAGMVAPVALAAPAAGVAAPAVIGAGSGALEYEHTIRETLAEAGVDTTDPSAIARALENPRLMARARERAQARGIAIGAFDALTAGLAGRLLAGARSAPGAVGRAGGELGVQAGGGMAGEATGQLAADGQVHSWGDVMMEGIAELPTAITEVPTNYRRAREASLRREGAPGPQPPEAVQDDYRDLAERFGATITSLDRTPERNRAVGGVPNSQHLRGTAGDFVVPEGQKAEFMAEARRRGYEAIDEGDHVHLELPPQRAGKAPPPPGVQKAVELVDEARRRRGLSPEMPGDGVKIEGEDVKVRAPSADELITRHRQALAEAQDLSRPAPVRRESKRLAQQLMQQIEALGSPSTSRTQAIAQEAQRVLDQLAQQSQQEMAAPPETPAPPMLPQTDSPGVQAPPPAPPMSAPAPAPAPVQAPVQAPSAPVAPPFGASPPPAPAPEPAPAPPPAASPLAPVSAEVTPLAEEVRKRLVGHPGYRAVLGDLAQGQVREVKMAAPVQAEADRLGRLLGRKVVFIDIRSPQGEGLVGLAADGRHIIVNPRAVEAGRFHLAGVVGHEFTHTLRKAGNRDLEALIQFARQRVNTDNSYVQRTYLEYRPVYSPVMSDERFADALTEELVADLIGDMLADERFWQELAQSEPSLFRRTLKRFIAFLRKLGERARRMGDDEAFREIDALRERAATILREHMLAVQRGQAQPQAGGDPRAALNTTDIRREAAIQNAAKALEAGEYHQAAAHASRASDDFIPGLPIDTPEQRQFFAGSDRRVNPSAPYGEARVYAHGTARNITAFRPKQGEATFMSPSPRFSGSFAAASMEWKDKNIGDDVVVDGQSMQEQKQLSPAGSADYAFADLMLRHGHPDRALEALPDYFYEGSFDIEYLDSESEAIVQERLTQLSDALATNPGMIEVRGRSDTAGMQIMPLVTNARKPWDYANKADVDALMEALRKRYGTPDQFRKATAMTYRLSDWDAVRALLEAGDWMLVENTKAGVPALLRELGYDSYFVTEMGVKNLAVFDPRQIKSAYGNVGPWGVREPTPEEAAQLGMTLEEAIAAQQAGDIRLKLGEARNQIPKAALNLNTVVAAQFPQLRSAWEGFTTAFERKLLDEFRDLRQVQDEIADAYFDGALPPELNAWRNENLRHGAYQDARERAERKFIEPIARILSKAGAGLEEFSDYLWWRHAGERDGYLRKHLDPKLAAQTPPDALAGIDPAEAQANIDALDSKKRAAFEQAAKFIDGMRKFTLGVMLRSGQISQQYHDAVLNQYRFYVPLRGMPDGSEALNRGTASGLNMPKKPLGLRATGRRTKPQNIIEEMMRDMENALVNEQKHKVLDALVRLIVTHPDASLWEVQPMKAQRKWVNGVLTVVPVPGDPKKQLTFMHKGMPVAIEIHHEGMRQAFLNMNEPLPNWLRKVQAVTRWLSAVKTSFSPFFLLVNPVRDAGLASMGVLAEHGADTLADFAAFYPLTYSALARDKRMTVQQSNNPRLRKLEVYAREFAARGGKTGYTYVNDIREQQRSLRRLVDRYSESKGIKDIAAGNFGTKDAALLGRKAFQKVAALFEVVNDMAENSTRLAVYAAMREKGLSVEDAAAYAKEVTVNFNRRGAISKYLNGFYMFFNAAVQGSARMVRLMGNKKFAAMMGGLFAASYALALGQMFAAGDDDDGESRYDKAIGDVQAQRSIGIYLGEGKSLAIPVPYGPNIFTYMGYRLAKLHYDIARGKKPRVGKAIGDIVAQMTTSMSPIDPGKGPSALLPEVARIPVQIAMNRNDFGGKIAPQLDPFDYTDNPRYHQTDSKTWGGYTVAAAALNTATGGSEYRGGFLNLTGEQVRYAVENMLGGMWRLGGESAELAQKLMSDVPVNPSDVPLANVYVRGRGEQRHAGPYYNNRDDYENTVADWKLAIERGDEEKIAEIIERAPWIEGAEVPANTAAGRAAQAGTVHEQVRRIRNEMEKLNRAKRQILADETLGKSERRRQAHEIDLEIAQLQQDYNYAINVARGYPQLTGSR